MRNLFLLSCICSHLLNTNISFSFGFLLLGIACSSGFASVFTEKVIKSAKSIDDREKIVDKKYGLAHMQAQLAIVSLVMLGLYAIIEDLDEIVTLGFFHNFSGPALISCLNSAIGGLIVASVLKYADSVLKGYATVSKPLNVLFTISIFIF